MVAEVSLKEKKAKKNKTKQKLEKKTKEKQEVQNNKKKVWKKKENGESSCKMEELVQSSWEHLGGSHDLGSQSHLTPHSYGYHVGISIQFDHDFHQLLFDSCSC